MRRNRSLASPTRARCVRAAKCGYLARPALFIAMTIHRALSLGVEADGLASIRGSKAIDAQVLIVDECSMIPVNLSATAMKRMLLATHTILLGDVDQFPPIGAGNPFADLIAKDCVRAMFRLEHNHRTGVEGIRGL